MASHRSDAEGPVLTSRSGSVAGARRLLQRKFRRSEGLFLVDGPQSVREALRCEAVVEVFVSDDATEAARDVALEASSAGIDVRVVDAQGMRGLSSSVTPQGVVGVARMAPASFESVLSSGPRLVVLLDSVSDPGNAGTVIRVADAAGADAVIVTRASVDVYNDKCVRATTGSLFHLPVVPEADGLDVIDGLRAVGVQVLGASGSGRDDLDLLADSGALSAPTLWVVGNEAHGVSPQIAAACDRLVRIPIHGRAESLNLSTAAAVLLYASAREQRRP